MKLLIAIDLIVEFGNLLLIDGIYLIKIASWVKY